MSDTKEKDEGPQNLPVDAGENRPGPDAVKPVPVPQQSDQLQAEELRDESEGGGSILMEVKQGGLDSGGVATIGVDTQVTAEAGDDGKFGPEVESKANASVEAGEGGNVDGEVECKATVVAGKRDVQGSVREGCSLGKQVDYQTQSQHSSGAESVAVQFIPGEKVAQNESAAVQSVPEGKVAQNESVAAQSIPHDTVVKNDAVSETLVKSVEPASDTVAAVSGMCVDTVEPAANTKSVVLPVSESKGYAVVGTPQVKSTSGELREEVKNEVTTTGEKLETEEQQMVVFTPMDNGKSLSKLSFLLDDDEDGNESGTEEEQAAFLKELENFFRERSMDFKPPKFYGEILNCLKLWRAVMRLGGYDTVTSCKLWRQVGESFRPPKTCTTVSWTFRGFYEKALLDYERHKVHGGEVTLPIAPQSEPRIEHQGSGSGRARRDAAARAMQGWHSQRLLGNGEVSDPIIRDKTPASSQKREKQLRNIGLLKRKKPTYVDSAVKLPPAKASKTQLDTSVVDLGPPADWVKINVQRLKDCFEVYALVPGLLREEVRVQSDPAGRLVISGEPEHPDNPWGVTPFKKVVSLPSRIDPHQTSAIVTLHGQLFVRVPFEPSE